MRVLHVSWVLFVQGQKHLDLRMQVREQMMFRLQTLLS
jgi:hypothetical protein